MFNLAEVCNWNSSTRMGDNFLFPLRPQICMGIMLSRLFFLSLLPVQHTLQSSSLEMLTTIFVAAVQLATLSVYGLQMHLMKLTNFSLNYSLCSSWFRTTLASCWDLRNEALACPSCGEITACEANVLFYFVCVFVALLLFCVCVCVCVCVQLLLYALVPRNIVCWQCYHYRLR
jgi:hypothetical protein